MATEWFYSRGGNQVGPVSSAELRACAERGTLRPDDWVWKQGMQDWVPARRINGLFPAPTEPSVLPEEPRHLPGLPSQPQAQAAPEYRQVKTPDGFGFHWYTDCWKKFGDHTGRARRMEYWTFFLFNNIIYILLAGADGALKTSGALSTIYTLAALIPGIMVGIRRLHDTGKSGWWMLISLLPCAGWLILLIFQVRDSEPGTNQYGPNPKRIN